MDWLDYREKLGIGFNDKEKTTYFIRKIFNILDDSSDSLRTQIDEYDFYRFCNMTGTRMQIWDRYENGYTSIIKTLSNHCSSLEDFLAYYIAFINCQKDSEYKRFTRENYKNIVCNLLNESHIPYEVYQDDDGYFIFPKGIAESDSALVSATLQWLSSYPKAEKAWSKALRDYSIASAQNASDVADKMRKALEAFFQEFFNNEKTLESNKAEYGRYLKSQGVPAEISNNYETLLQAYTNFMNGYAKHHDKTELKVLEYLMYQTGNIMRLLITIRSEETNNAD